MNAAHHAESLIHLLTVFNSKDVDDDAIDGPAMAQIFEAGNDCANASYESPDDFLAALKVFKEYREIPDFADAFCNRLFNQMIAAI